MGCIVETQTTFPSFTTDAFGDDVLQTDVEYDWGADVTQNNPLLGPGQIHRFHYIINPGTVFDGWININTIAAPVAGDHSSRIVTFVAKPVNPYVPVVFTHLFSGGNISLRDSIPIGIYGGESITFAWHSGDARWYEIERNLHSIIASNRAGAAIGNPGGSEGAPGGVIAILPTISFDGSTEFNLRITYAFGGAVDLTSAGYLALTMNGVSIGRILAVDHAPNRQDTVMIHHTWTPLLGARTFAVSIWGTAGSGISLPAHTGPGGPGDIVNSQVTLSRSNT